MRYRIWVFFVVLAQAASAQDMTPLRAIESAAMEAFDEMPAIAIEEDPAACGRGDGVNPRLAYCTSTNKILLFDASGSEPVLTYELSHLYGHAVQVRHGVADVALRTIRARREEEQKLRGWVTRQAECIAGFIHARAGLPDLSLLELFEDEPMTDSHWGRDPLTVGPKVSIGLQARAEWFATGREGDISKCAVGEFGSELLVEALK